MRVNRVKYIMGTILATVLIGCGSGGTSSGSLGGGQNNTSNPSTNNQGGSNAPIQCKKITQDLNVITAKYVDLPVTYISEKGSKGSKGDTGGETKGSSGGGGIHNQGRACAQCHSGTFNSGATVFTNLHAATKTIGASGYKIQLNNSMVYTTGRGTGNSHLTRFSGGKFTANVIDMNGNIVNSSATLSHDSSRLDCNRCHSAAGAGGAPGRIVNYRVATTAVVPANVNTTKCVSFSGNVMPILTAKCKTCHGSNGNFSVTSGNATYANMNRLKSSSTAAGKYLIDKASGTIAHGGGSVIPASSAEYKTLQAWISEGASNN